MCSGSECIGYLFFAAVIGFALIIFFGLRYGKAFLARNLTLTVDRVWVRVADRATKLRLAKTNLLYGIWLESSATESRLLVRNADNVDCGRVDYTIGRRQYGLSVGENRFFIVFPLTWKRTAFLKAEGSETVLASYSRTGIFGKHVFDIPDYGSLISERPRIDLQLAYNYRLGGREVAATVQEISPWQQVGRLGLLPSELPLAVRIFILAV